MNKNIKKVILKRIKSEDVKMKPKWRFALDGAIIRGGWAILFLASSLLLSFTVYLIKIMNPRELWEFGSLGAEVFVEDFPYWFTGGVILTVVGSIILLSKIGENYKKNIKILAVWVSLLTILLTAIISLSRP